MYIMVYSMGTKSTIRSILDGRIGLLALILRR